jgi:hypothetical protein
LQLFANRSVKSLIEIYKAIGDFNDLDKADEIAKNSEAARIVDSSSSSA